MLNIIKAILFILISTGLLYFICTWKLFKLAGRKSWEAIIPIYNILVTLKIMQRPWWWILLFFIPIVGSILLAVFFVDFMRCYGKKSIWNTIGALSFSLFYVGYINYMPNTKFIGVEKRTETLISALIFAVVFATVIHTFIIQPYTIPTSSMERTLLVGDFLFVSKLNYGARIPMTPVALPFLQSKIPFTGEKPHNQIDSYIDAIRLPYMRIPGWEKVKRYDIVTFNYPVDSSHTAIDRKDPYVKRCLGMPGDSLSLKNGRVFINGKEEQLPADAQRQFSYFCLANGGISDVKIQKLLGYTPYFPIGQEGNTIQYYFQGLPDKEAKEIESWSNVIAMKENIDSTGRKTEHFYDKAHTVIDSTNTIFPEDKNWNGDQYGPLYIPKKGDKIKLTKDNITQYYNIISKYEGDRKIDVKGDEILIDGKPTSEYEIQKDYYFMIGDNRDASLDSRYWGYVPDDHILGKPVFVWLSIQGMFDDGVRKTRWDRMFKRINTGEANKTSYLPHFLVLLAIYFGWDYFRNRKKKKNKK
ncbi:MAG: signal peptidase I [Flavobacteriales bacterium]|nr:signal peptidase I [Flavobacteriales bacterium]